MGNEGREDERERDRQHDVWEQARKRGGTRKGAERKLGAWAGRCAPAFSCGVSASSTFSFFFFSSCEEHATRGDRDEAQFSLLRDNPQHPQETRPQHARAIQYHKYDAAPKRAKFER